MQYKEINSNNTYVLKTGPGYLQGITVNVLDTLNNWRPEKPKEHKPFREYSWPSQSGLNWMQ